MALDLRLNQKQIQTMVMTPQLQQAIKLLQLNQMELKDEILTEMMENPLLELTAPADSAEAAADHSLADPKGDQTPDNPKNEKDEFAEIAGQDKEKIQEEFDWENYLDEYSSAPSTAIKGGSHEMPEDSPSFESYIAAKTNLTDHLNWQWRFLAKNEEELFRGLIIIGNLNDDGYLTANLESLSQQANCSIEKMAKILNKIQSLDPDGVAARDLSECLTIQLDKIGLKNSIAFQIAEKHLSLLEKKDLNALCRELNEEKETIIAAIEAIRALNPRPGKSFSDTDSIYITPDVYVIKSGDEYIISLNEDGLPKLRISAQYRKLIKNSQAESETRKYLTDKLKGAAFLIRSIHQRQRTIFRVTEAILKVQKDFLDYGIEYLKPLILKDIAEELGYHESTISRVTTNKYVHTPRGIFELKYFFDSPINRLQGEALGSESVKNKIKQIISEEDPLKPFSDQKIADELKASNIDIARRTVAKYRESLGIASSSERKEMF